MQRRKLHIPLSAAALSLLSTLFSSPGWTLPEDRAQPITIQSDSAEQRIVDGKETTLYNGSVVMVQGSLHIKGDTVTVFSENRSVTRIVAIGKLAFFSQQNEAEKPPVEAQAETIEYQLSNDTIVFLNQATLTQGASSLSGQRIDYNTNTAQVKAAGSQEGNEAASSTGRVNMVLEPKRKNDSAEANGVSTPIANPGPAPEPEPEPELKSESEPESKPKPAPEPEPVSVPAPASGDVSATAVDAPTPAAIPAATPTPTPTVQPNTTGNDKASAQTDDHTNPKTDLKDSHADAVSQ
ncbi:lipopolysaccharide transport periplasmic protein LptA [Dasania marina]|uniref:lipopolysaccharide transport periplasmic protein LptA n=1 Tax=Dasania marina TaxID=471499 RepID=UPI0030D71736|tara:strand:+ start:26801 stop:27685 length:885 start_codon:yes stop_codon:yes gene_type:complete